MPSSPKRRRPPASTPDGREQQLIDLAIDLAEQKLMDGSASNQIITHYLKLATSRERLEKERLERENELLRAKTESFQASKQSAEFYQGAIDAIRSYRGYSGDEYDYSDL